MSKKKVNTIKENIENIYDDLDLRYDNILLLMGNPGIGKSTIVREFAKERGIRMEPLIASALSPFDINGSPMPNHETKTMDIYDFGKLKRLRPGDILFIDEVPNTPLSILNSVLVFLEDRELPDGTKIDDVMIIAAGNYQGMQPWTPQIKERFIFVDMPFVREEWEEFIMPQFGIPKNIAQKLSKLILDEKFEGKNNFNSARSVTKAIRRLLKGVDIGYAEVKLALNTIVPINIVCPLDIVDSDGKVIYKASTDINWEGSKILMDDLKKSFTDFPDKIQYGEETLYKIVSKRTTKAARQAAIEKFVEKNEIYAQPQDIIDELGNTLFHAGQEVPWLDLQKTLMETKKRVEAAREATKETKIAEPTVVTKSRKKITKTV